MSFGCVRVFKLIMNECKKKINQYDFCSLTTALKLFSTIRNIGVIIHGPNECGYSVANDEADVINRETRSGTIGFVEFSEHDVVLGSMKKLQAGIISFYERYKFEIIVVLKTCISAITGENYAMIIDQIEKKIDTKIYLIESEGLKYNTNKEFFQYLADSFFKKVVKGHVEKDKNIINIIITQDAHRKDFKEITRMLSFLNITPHFVPSFADIESIKNMSKALCSSYICATPGTAISKMLDKDFGVREIAIKPPIGLQNTRNWLLRICEEYSLSNSVVDNVEKTFGEFENKLQKIREVLAGKSVIITAGSGIVDTYVDLCREYGLKILVVGCSHSRYDKWNTIPHLEDIEVYDDIQWYELFELVQEKKIDFYIGRQNIFIELICSGTQPI